MRKERPPWLAAVRGNPLNWLLGEDNPPVRYRTLTELLGRPEDDTQVVQAKRAVWEYLPVRRLLEALDAPIDPPSERTPFKFRLRDLDVLYRFGVPAGHPAIDEAVHRLLDCDVRPGPGCYGPQAVAGLVRYANPDDPRLKRWVRYLVRNEPFADGNRPGVIRHRWRMSCCGSHSCFSAVARSLWAAGGIPESLRAEQVRRFIRRGADYLAAHRVYQSNHHGFRPIRKDWLELHLPFGLDWRTDVLDLLNVATLIGLADDPSVVPALRWLLSRQDAGGRWRLERRYRNSRDILAARVWDEETVGKPSKWITLQAVTVLKRCAALVERIARGEQLDLPPDTPKQPTFAPYRFPYAKTDETRVRNDWDRFGMTPLLAKLLRFADANAVKTGWRWGFVMGPKRCREWCAAEVRWVPRKGDKLSWPVCRIYFLARAGQFTPGAVSKRLKIPVEDEQEKRRFNKFFWNSLWRIRTAAWKDGFDEIAVTLRDPKEFGKLRPLMREALAGLS